MFASQLLRILQTLPTHTNHETCVFDTAELEAVMKKNQNGALCDPNNGNKGEADVESEVNKKDEYWVAAKLEYSMVVEDITNSSKNEVRGSVASLIVPSRETQSSDERDGDLYSDNNDVENGVSNEKKSSYSIDPLIISSCKKELFEKDMDLYMDKDVMECELPELMGCYKENANHVVKDICIDEGVPPKARTVTESGQDQLLCTRLPSDGSKNGSMSDRDEIGSLSPDGSEKSSEDECYESEADECGTKEKVEIGLLISDTLECSSGNDFEDDIANGGQLLAPMQTADINRDAASTKTDDVSGGRYMANSKSSSPELSEQNSLKSLFESPDCGSIEVEQKCAQIPCLEVMRESPAVVSAAEESKKRGHLNELFYNSKVESTTITFDFNSSEPPAPSGRDESPDDDDCEQQPLKVDRKPTRNEPINPDSLEAACEVQHGHGESSFSMAGPASGLITYSGPVPYSGSVSLRSDSSTTSTRSFAFPVLQSEWNSSPVRMAKADRRHYRRHKGWRCALLCCRF